MNRRKFLSVVPAVALSATVPVSMRFGPPPAVSPEERLDAAIKELQAAAQALDPSLKGWSILTDTGMPRASFAIFGHRA